MSNTWNWTEASNEEFEKRRHNETYYRIFHKIDNGNTANDYKFWAKDDSEALNVLNKFQNEHEGQYFYSTSGYYCNSNNERFDSMQEMNDAWNKEVYDESDRAYDIEKIEDFKEDYNSKERANVLESLKKLRDDISEIISIYSVDSKSLYNKICAIDIKTVEPEIMDSISNEIHKVNQEYYKAYDLEYLIRTKHNVNEGWSLYNHVLNDLKYNVKKMLESDSEGYPTTFIKNAAEELNVDFDSETYMVKDESKSKEVGEKAIQIWRNELKKFYDHLLAYNYYTNYGIVEPNDVDLIEFSKREDVKVPTKPGTDGEVDYKQNYEIILQEWNAIFDWLKIYGMNLWD